MLWCPVIYASSFVFFLIFCLIDMQGKLRPLIKIASIKEQGTLKNPPGPEVARANHVSLFTICFGAAGFPMISQFHRGANRLASATSKFRNILYRRNAKQARTPNAVLQINNGTGLLLARKPEKEKLEQRTMRIFGIKWSVLEMRKPRKTVARMRVTRP